MIHNFRPSLIRRAGLAVNRCSQLNVDRNCLPFQRTDSTFGRRLVSTAPIKVGYSGYETSQFLDPQKDKVLLERSILNGCKTVVFRSSEYALETYELLVDLSATEDMDLAQVSLIHLLPEPTSADLDSLEQWKKELLGIQDVLAQGDRSLDSFCLPVASATSVNIQQTCENAMQLSKSLGREFQTGVYFDTATMCKLSAAEIAEVQAALQQSLPQVVLVATNSMTMHAAVPIIQTAKALNLLTISSEVLRCHSKRPGLLSDSVYDKYHSTTIKTTVEKKVVDVTITDDSKPPASEAIRKLSREVEETAKEFHVALDRCLQAEKIFLNNFRDSMPSIPVTDFCLAHVLGNSYKQFLYPEEWSYMVRQKVNPAFQQACQQLKQQNKNCNDWVAAYFPMGKFLIASFQKHLQARSMLISQEVFESVISSLSCNTSDDVEAQNTVESFLAEQFPTSASLPCLLAIMAQLSTGCDVPLVAGNEVLRGEWKIIQRALHTPVGARELRNSISTNLLKNIAMDSSGNSNTDDNRIDSLYAKIRRITQE